MEFLEVVFPVSGVRTNILLPPLVAMSISFFTSMAGVSGAFLLLPFQMSVLGYTTPSVSATNFVYNIVGIPGGAARYIKEGRMHWPLTLVIIAGTLPGVFTGYYLRVAFLVEPGKFKVFAACVLLYIGLRLFHGLGKSRSAESGLEGVKPHESFIKAVSTGLLSVEFEFKGERYAFRTLPLFLLSLVVGVVGGAYGIGGGAIIAPFLVTAFRLPVYTVAGAALMGTLVTSVAGVVFYSVAPSAHETSPDWLLGLLFGLGGLIGMYFGAKAQRHVPQRLIKIMLGAVILSLSAKYFMEVIL